MWSLLSEFRIDRKDGDGIQVQWSPQTLHRLLGERLPGTEVIAVLNREPYIHNRDNGSIALQIPASGLVAARQSTCTSSIRFNATPSIIDGRTD